MAQPAGTGPDRVVHENGEAVMWLYLPWGALLAVLGALAFLLGRRRRGAARRRNPYGRNPHGSVSRQWFTDHWREL